MNFTFQGKANAETRALRVGLPNIEKENDPASIIITNDYFLIRNLAITLLWMSSDSEYYGFLAKEWFFSEDGKTLTFKLWENRRFSNGKLITSKHVAFSLKRLILVGSSLLDVKNIIVGAQGLQRLDQDIEGIQTPNKFQIVLQFHEPYRRILYFFSRPESAIVHPNNINPKTLVVMDWSISSGPYWGIKKDNSFILRRNLYFNDPSIISGDMPDEVQLLGVPELYKGFQMIKHRELDILNYGAVFDPIFKELETIPSLRVISEVHNATCYFQVKPNSQKLADKSVRHYLYQLFQSVDWRPYESSIFQQAGQLFGYNSRYHLTDNEKIPIEQDWADHQRNTNISLPTLNVFYPDFFGEAYLTKLRENFEKLPISVRLTVIPAKEWETYYREGDWDLLFTMQEMFPPHMEYVIYYLYKNAEIALIDPNKKVDSILKKINDENVEEHIHEISKIIYNETPLMPLFYSAWPIYIYNEFEFIDYNDFEVNFMLWKVRKNKS